MPFSVSSNDRSNLLCGDRAQRYLLDRSTILAEKIEKTSSPQGSLRGGSDYGIPDPLIVSVVTFPILLSVVDDPFVKLVSISIVSLGPGFCVYVLPEHLERMPTRRKKLGNRIDLE